MTDYHNGDNPEWWIEWGWIAGKQPTIQTGNNTNKRVKRVNDKYSQVKHKVDELQ